MSVAKDVVLQILYSSGIPKSTLLGDDGAARKARKGKKPVVTNKDEPDSGSHHLTPSHVCLYCMH